MDIELLRTFLEIRKTRHFGQAAENLYLTQAAVSARIKQLEVTIGTPLFTRFRNNLQLTPTGERLVEYAETIVIAWARAKQDVSLKEQQKRVAAIGATSGLWDLLIQDALHDIHRALPSLALRADSHPQDTLVRQLLERTLDLAFVYEPPKINYVHAEPIAKTALILVSTNAQLNAKKALQESFVSIDWGLAFKMTFTKTFTDAPTPVLHTSLAKIALEFIIKFGGCAYLPFQMVESLLGSTLHQVTDAPVISRQIYACYHIETPIKEDLERIIFVIKEMDASLDNDLILPNMHTTAIEL